MWPPGSFSSARGGTMIRPEFLLGKSIAFLCNHMVPFGWMLMSNYSLITNCTPHLGMLLIIELLAMFLESSERNINSDKNVFSFEGCLASILGAPSWGTRLCGNEKRVVGVCQTFVWLHPTRRHSDNGGWCIGPLSERWFCYRRHPVKQASTSLSLKRWERQALPDVELRQTHSILMKIQLKYAR